MRRCGVGRNEGVSGDIRFLLGVLQTNCAILLLSILESLAVLPVRSSSVLTGRVKIHCQILHSCKSNIILGLSAWGDRRGREDWLTPSLTQCLPRSRRNLARCWAFSRGSKLAI